MKYLLLFFVFLMGCKAIDTIVSNQPSPTSIPTPSPVPESQLCKDFPYLGKWHHISTRPSKRIPTDIEFLASCRVSYDKRSASYGYELVKVETYTTTPAFPTFLMTFKNDHEVDNMFDDQQCQIGSSSYQKDKTVFSNFYCKKKKDGDFTDLPSYQSVR